MENVDAILYSDHVVKKLKKIRDLMPSLTIVAQIVFKKLVPRSQNDFELKEITISQAYEFIEKLKPSKSCGNNEINNFIVKQIPQFMALSITHLFNHMVRSSTFPDVLKTSRVIPIKKPKKPGDHIDSFRPINSMHCSRGILLVLSHRIRQ